jgi:hypothetical protein
VSFASNNPTQHQIPNRFLEQLCDFKVAMEPTSAQGQKRCAFFQPVALAPHGLDRKNNCDISRVNLETTTQETSWSKAVVLSIPYEA